MLRTFDPRLLPTPSEGEYLAGPLGFELAGASYAPGDVVPVWDHLQPQHLFAEVGQGRLEVRRFPVSLAHVKELVDEEESRLQSIRDALEKAQAEAEAMAEALEALGSGLMALSEAIQATKAGGAIGAQIEALAVSTKASEKAVRKSTRRKSRTQSKASE